MKSWVVFFGNISEYMHLLEQLLCTPSPSMNLRSNLIHFPDISFTNLQHTILELPNPTRRFQTPLPRFLHFYFPFDRHQNSRFLCFLFLLLLPFLFGRLSSLSHSSWHSTFRS